MKRINYLFTALGTICALLSFVLYADIYVFISMMVIYLMFSIGIRRCNKKSEIIFLTILDVWITLYNILYIILRYSNIIDLYSVKWRFELQFMIPFLIAYIIKAICKNAHKVI